MSELIQTHLQDRVLTLRLNRPEKKNALTQAMYAAMAEALSQAATNPEVRVVLFTGVPDAFSAGNDLQDFLSNPPAGEDAPVARFMRTLAVFPKPVVAAVNGVAVGIGVTLLLHCDLVYAGQNARLQMPFTNIGICPEFASTYLLPRIMGNVRAAELVMFGEPFGAAKAHEYGLVNAVLPDTEVEPHALERARKLAQQPPNALRVTKKLMRRWSESTAVEAIKIEADHFIPMLRQAEALEAMSAFMQKRKPDFSKFN
ncbi:MAG: enoyl-CoA hydratase [Nevskia sp.]|nr:enoyl-CoA hydratase [Nevskia sp.]